MNTQDGNISAKKLTPEPTPITRAALIEKLIEYRSDDWDENDTDEALRYGRFGFTELSNDDLEQLAVDFMLEDADGNEVRYTITDADTSQPSAEAKFIALADHIAAMADDAYLTGHPEWLEIVKAAQVAKMEGR